MTAPLLQVDDLRMTITTHDLSREVLGGLTFSVAEGESVGLVGESGSGKSMTVRSIIRLLPSTATVTGSIAFDGREVLQMRPAELRRYRSHDVAMMFQDPRAHINPIRSIGSFLTEQLMREQGVGKQEANRRAIELLGDVGVSSPARRMAQRPHEFSGGLLQRVMICAALLARPRLILADEISTALDVTTQEEVMAILDEQRRDRKLAMLFITHDLDLASAVCDRLLVLKDGRIVESLRAGHEPEATHPYSKTLLGARSWFDEPAAQRGGAKR